jgi:hypothetical protein
VAEIPEVKGTFEAAAAPANATAGVVAAGFGIAVEFDGLRTLFQLLVDMTTRWNKTYALTTCMTPLLTRMSVIST